MTVGPPKRQHSWLLTRSDVKRKHIEVKREDTGSRQTASVRIVDAYAVREQREEHVTILSDSADTEKSTALHL